MACDLNTKKLNDLYSSYFEDSLLFETSQDYFTYLVSKLKLLKEELPDISEDEFRSILQEGYDNGLQGDTDLIDAKNDIIAEIKTNFPAEAQNFFTEGNMLLLFRDLINNTPITEENTENNNEKTLTISLEDVLDLGKEFLFTYFKDSTDMSDDFEKIAKSYLVKSFLVNYDKERIIEKSQLNDEIRGTQQELVNQIIEYLKLVDGKSLKGVWIDFQGKNFRISELENSDVFHQDHSSTGLYEALLPVIKLHLNVQGMSTGMLNNIYANKHKEPIYYNAIMAVTLLSNFNNYLKSVFGEKNLDIQNTQQRLNYRDSYFFSEKGDGNITTYRVDENPDVVKETNSITKLIFETVPYYTFNSNEPVPGQYLNFPQASRVIADLKTLGKLSDFKSLKTLEKIKKYNLIDDKGNTVFSSDTNEVLLESDVNSLADIIAKIRLNPQKYFSALLEILCDEHINTEILTLDLNLHVQNIMYSMYRTLFSSKHNSLKKLNKVLHRLYPQVTQFIDTVYKVELVQYNTDEDGLTHAYLLAENEVNNQKNYIDLSVYQFNAKGTGSYAVHQNTYNIQGHFDKESTFSHITFIIPDTNYQVQVNRSGEVKILENGKQVKNLDLTKENKFRWFVEHMLHVKIGSVGHDSDFFKALKSIQKSAFADVTGADLMNKMFEMSARVLLYLYVNDNISNSTEVSNFLSEKARPDTHRIFKDEIMMISRADFKGIVLSMAEAMCIVNGNVTASQVKNGEGKAQGLTTLSRLMNSKNSQWLLQNKREDSAVKEFSLYDLIEDVYVTVEKHDLSSTKPVNKFSVSEGIYSQFVIDFIGGLVDHSTDRNVFGNGKIGILGSVNSDKNTVAKLVLNLSKRKVTWKDSKGKVKSKFLIEKNEINISNEEFIELINYELGNYYYKHMKNVLSDWFTLLNSLGVSVSPTDSIHTLINAFNDLYTRIHTDPEFLQNEVLKDETRLEYLSRVVAEYNLKSGNFLEFIDQIHYIDTKEGFTINKTTESLLFRFKPDAASEFDIDASAYLSSDEFWLELDFNMFKSLFESDFQLKLINTKNVNNATNLESRLGEDGKTKKGVGSIGSPEHDYLLSDSGWVNDTTKEFIYAKVSILGLDKSLRKSYNITSSLTANRVARKLRNYLFELYKNVDKFEAYINGEKISNISELTISDLLRVTTADGNYIFKLDLNNKLRQYNYLDYLFSQEYLISTVGSHIAHPDKNKINIANNTKLDTLSEESARFNAQHKRNVSQTATMKEYQLNDIFGVPIDMNVAVVQDIIDFQNTVNGDTDKIKPYDGACIVNPFMVLLENYSLGADAAGYVKKPFFHAYKERFGTGIIIKTAGFGITNDNLRNLAGTKILMKKMTNRRWRDHNGNVITEYNVFDSKIPGGTFSGTSFNKIFYMKNGEVYNRKLEWISGTKYKATDYKLDDTGLVISENSIELVLDTNYRLWEAFGGEFSCHYDSKKGSYVYDESSIEAVVEIMNSTGYRLNSKGEIRYQDDFYQPLKHSDIHYLATEGAIKQGASNINSAKVYHTSTLESNDYDDLSLSYMKVKLLLAGIQLDKEHHADKAELSLMTLVISACALKGYTISEALHLYQALASIGEAQLSEFYKIVKDYVTLDANASLEEKLTLTDQIRGLLYDTLISTLSKLEVDLNNIASAMAYKIIQNYRNNKSMTLEEKLLPISDTTMFKKLVSNLAVYLSNKGIKVKVQGILAILNPSYDLFKLYNGKKLEEYSDSRTFVATEGLLKSWMSASRGELVPAVTYETVEIRATAKSTDYFQIEKDEASGIFNLYRSFGPSSDEFSELLIGVALYLPVNSRISSFINEEALTKLLQLGFEKVGTRPLENGIVVPILKKVKSLPKELLLEQLKAPSIKASQVRLGNSYYITRRVIGNGGVENFVTNKQSIISIADYKNLSRETAIVSIRPNYTDGGNLSAYNIVYQATSPDGTKVNLGLYDSDAIYWENEFKQIVRKCPDSSKKLLDFLKYVTGISDEGYNARIALGETFDDELQYYQLIQSFFETDNNVFGGFYFLGKTTSNFILTSKYDNNDKYINIAGLNAFVLARLSRIVQHNLSALSETRERIEDDFARLYSIYYAEDTTPEAKSEIYNYWKRFIVAVTKNGYMPDITPEEVFSRMHLYIQNTTSILVNGVLYKVDPNSVNIQTHQCVMPKTMATKYGLQIHDNLSAIKNDVGFFYKRFKLKYQRLLTNDNDFTLELKRLNGDHVYLITQEDLAESQLKEKTDVYFNYIDGKRWRVDALGHRIYQVSSENDKIYVNEATGVEVIKTDNLTFYLDNLDYQNIEISRASSWDPTTGDVNIPAGSEQRIDEVIEAIKSSTNKIAKRVYSYYKNVGIDEEIDETEETEETEVTYKQVALGNKERSSIDERFTDKTDDEVILDYLNGNRDYIPDFVLRMIKNTLEIHSSFLLSLNILAARIPAQCMQSFMAMEVVAFNNSDTSNAYVATSQIYLLGSDFDIDAVSLETFSFDANGRFYDWSPYFNLLTSRDLNRSLKIPFPTFKEVTLREKASDSVIQQLIKDGFIKIDEEAKTVKFRIKDINNLIKILSITELPTLLSIYKDDSLNKLVLERVLKFIDNHNMYFNKKSAKQIEGASANYAMYNSYKIAADPANQILAMTSVDSTTRPMKIEGDKSKKAKALANRGPGNWINKIEAINENSVGKDCIAICATGIKVFTAATFTNNYILNEMPDLQEYLLFEVKSERDEKGEKINITHQLLANIKAKNPNTVTNEEVYELLLSVNDDVDAALVLSALLSLSTDNAKELQLSKLNATAEMIGMYIYGISIGMDFRDLAKTLMSDTGELIMKLRNADGFNDTPTFYNFYSIFEHLEMDPNLNAYSYKVRGIRSPKSFLDEFLQREAKKLYENSKSKDYTMTLVEYLFRHKGVKDENGELRAYNVYDLKDALTPEVFNRVDHIKKDSEGDITDSDVEAFKIIWNQMFEYLALWHQQHKSVAGYVFVKEADQNMYINSELFNALDSEIQDKYKKYLNFDYLKIKRLAEGASEMKIAGQMLGINKGFKSTIDDLIALQSVICKAFNDRSLWKTFKGNLYNFKKLVEQSPQEPFLRNYAQKYKNYNVLRELVFDGDKKNSIIEEYNKIKHTFNLPLILTTLPNYHEYYKALVTTDVLLNNGSFLYKAITELVTDLSLDLKVYSTTEISNIRKGIEKYVTHKIISSFLNTDRTLNGGLLTFEIPTNSAYVSNTGSTVVNKGGSLTFKTGNDATNYTFKMFMELVVIPSLLRGELTPGSRYFFLENNPFIANLVPVINDRTHTKVPTMLMTSNINLLPTNPEEDTLFKLYSAAFKEIAQQIFTSGSTYGNSIADLFFVYDLFVNNNTLSQNSFKKLFVSPVETVSQLQTNFYNYVNNLDKTIKTREELLNTIFGSESLLEVYNELLPYILKPYAGNVEFATSPYLVVQAEDGSITIKRKAEPELVEDQYIDPNYGGDDGIVFEKYETISTNRYLTPATFYGMDVEVGAYLIESYNNNTSSFKYRIVSVLDNMGRLEIDVNGKIYNVEIPIKQSKEGAIKIDKNYLIGVVENIINPC